ncbi:protein mono-ADP-ribosyltransferase PARP15-like [Lampetra fluviatilis]
MAEDDRDEQPYVVLEMPEKWEPMGEEHLKLILLNETSQEYQDVKKNIMETLLNKTIISIKRIQNWRLYQCYMIMKKSVDQKNEGKQNERILFHGTVKTSLHNINNSGFNRNYCGKNGTVYGKGAYFAREAIYSDSYATPDAKTSHKHIYQARVLTGDFCVGDTLMVEPPLKKSSQLERFNSVVNNNSSPTIFVVFHDDQAYPEYLIEYL